LLKVNGEDVKVVQELLRHASSTITLDVYAQAVTPDQRRAQTKVADMLRGGVGPGRNPYWPLLDLRPFLRRL
jgi:integrase